MTKTLESYLGNPASVMLAEQPFRFWPVEKSYENDLDEPIIYYVFPQHGLELCCDWDDRINTIFLNANEFKYLDDRLLNALFSSSREQVRECLGPPSKSGGPLNDSILGVFGVWERFTRPGHMIHVEYCVDADRVKKITLMV